MLVICAIRALEFNLASLARQFNLYRRNYEEILRKFNNLSAQLDKKEEELLKAQLLKTEAEKKVEESLSSGDKLRDQQRNHRKEIDSLKVRREKKRWIDDTLDTSSFSWLLFKPEFLSRKPFTP